MLVWPVSKNCRIVADWITPEGPKTNTVPLRDPGLFWSFARLGARGEPSKASIKKWVGKYGLPTGENLLWELPLDEHFRQTWPPGPGQYIRQESGMRMEDFRAEVRCANQLLNLYADISARAHDRITQRFTTPPESGVAKPTVVDRLMAAYWISPLGAARHEAVGRSPRPPWYWFEAALDVFTEAIHNVMTGVRLEATDLSWPLYDGRTTQDGGDFRGFSRLLACRDLLSAIYLQFYLMATSHKPLRRCEACGEPFPLTRKDKLVCNATCRSKRRRQRDSL